jgi:hypothetical protein
LNLILSNNQADFSENPVLSGELAEEKDGWY